MAAVSQVCEQCGREFLTTTKRLNSGGGHICSLSCAASKPRRPLLERFLAKINKTERCWLWTGSFNSGGYGVIWTGKRKTLASRVAWELFKGPIGDNLCVLHNCPDGDNPACVNPEHLFLGTKGDNNTDRAEKGRNKDQKGEKNEQAILTEFQVLEIRARYAAGGVTQRSLAKEFGVHFAGISDIINRKNWRHI